MMNINIVGEDLKMLGLDEKEVKIYLALIRAGLSTPLELSRATDLNRTTIYRVLESLKKYNLAEEIVDQFSTKVKAADPEKLKSIIARKQGELDRLNSTIPGLIAQLNEAKNQSFSPTRVIYYRGKSGLQQLLWNTLGTAGKTRVVGYGYLNWNDGVGKHFAEKLREEYVMRKIYSKEIQNPVDKEPIYTEVVGYNQFYQNRYLPKSKLAINHDTYIYDDVFAFYHIFKDEYFGVEVHNPEITKTQRQIFYLLWQLAKKSNSNRSG